MSPVAVVIAAIAIITDKLITCWSREGSHLLLVPSVVCHRTHDYRPRGIVQPEVRCDLNRGRLFVTRIHERSHTPFRNVRVDQVWKS